MSAQPFPTYPTHLQGTAAARLHAEKVDDWLRTLLGTVTLPSSVALVALGGYGRGDLAPQSDLDLLLTYPKKCPADLPDQLWYPIWNSGVKLGHSVRSIGDTLKLAKSDLDTATAILDARVILGEPSVAEKLRSEARDQWLRYASRNVSLLADSILDRHARFDDVAFAVEPDLKNGKGGLRDSQALRWAQLAGRTLPEADSAIEAAVDVLNRVRIALHRVTGRPVDQLLVEWIDQVAVLVGHDDRDSLMGEVAGAARTIAWACDELVYDLINRPDPDLRQDPQFEGRGGRVGHRPSVTTLTAEDGLRLATEAARQSARITPDTLQLLGQIEVPESWTDSLRHGLVELLSTGRAAIPVIEALDHCRFWSNLIPEWAPTRSRPQHNPYHAFTVDRHLLETVAVAATLPSDRPDLLLFGALLHDIGKGYSGDHSEVGEQLARLLLARAGMSEDDIDTVAVLVHHHLLLPDTATRRDLDDPETLRLVAERVGRTDRLDLLNQLAIADGVATGSTAWSDWKARLVRQLVERVRDILEGTPGGSTDFTQAPSPTTSQLAQLATAGTNTLVEIVNERLIVTTADRPGLFSRITGAVALHGLDIRDARISCIDGVAIDELHVESTFPTPIDWNRVSRDVQAAADGSLAITARLARRASSYRSRPVTHTLEPAVHIIPRPNAATSIVEVVGPDSLGVLYRLACAFAELNFGITRAMVSTVGNDIVDVFYVSDPDGTRLRDDTERAELKLALSHALNSRL